jgi:hypothetical protein
MNLIKNDNILRNAIEANAYFVNAIKSGTREVVLEVIDNFIPSGLTALAVIAFDFRNVMFLNKLDKFFRNIIVLAQGERDELIKLIEKNNDFLSRVINIIDKLEEESKVEYVVNLFRALSLDFIDKDEFFRLNRILTNVISEDLDYLKKHIEDKKIPEDVHMIALRQENLAYQSAMDANGDDRFDFNNWGKKLFLYGIEFNNLENYSELRKSLEYEPSRDLWNSPNRMG